jgi:hypothetical protein
MENNTVSTTTTAAPKANKLKKLSAKVNSPKSAIPAKATASTAKAKGAKAAPKDVVEKKTGINIGKTTGMRVMRFQDYSFEINDRQDRRRTNDELAADWRAEFPQSRAVLNGRITGEMVAAVRALFNAGTNGHGTPGQTHDSKPYVVVNGKRVKTEPVRKVKAVAAKTAAPVAKTKATGVKKVADKTAAA